MKQKLSELASIAEIVGAFAVVISLIVVVQRVRAKDTLVGIDSSVINAGTAIGMLSIHGFVLL